MRESDSDIVKEKGGACVDCPLTEKRFAVDFPSRRPTLKVATSNARVRVCCPAYPKENLIKVKAGLPSHTQCPHFKKWQQNN